MRHRSLVSAICSQRRQSDKRKKRQREVQRGKLFACESKDFSDHSCSESHRKRRRKRTRSHVLRRTTSFPVLSVTWTLCSRLIHQTEEDMKTGKKSFIGRCSFNSLCYETVWGITCSLSGGCSLKHATVILVYIQQFKRLNIVPFVCIFNHVTIKCL